MQNAASPARSRVLLAGIRDGLPIGLGYLAVSFSLGIAARNAGLNAFQGFLISLLNNASAGEYAAFTVIAADSGFLEDGAHHPHHKRPLSAHELLAQPEVFTGHAAHPPAARRL